MASTTDKITHSISTTGSTIKGIAKIALTQRSGTPIRAYNRSDSLIILGNGPSLRQTIDGNLECLLSHPTMAVNFAANTDEFFQLRPSFYVLADPHFANTNDPNVAKLYDRLTAIDWDMQLIVPYGFSIPAISNNRISISRFAATGVEGNRWLRFAAIDRRIGMPRPRNVLVCAIMCGIWLGFKEIYLCGADHTWTRTLSVNSDNKVVTIQPHFYKEPQGEKERVTSVYNDIRLHEILESFSIAFKAYHDIRQYADARNIRIVNTTPGSFIDAFERGNLP